MKKNRAQPKRSSLIQAYGLFWRSDEVHWSPGKGDKTYWRLYGRRGAIRENLRVVDFRDQKGIYILYGNYGPYYVGLTRKRGLGARLKDHLFDKHAGKWDRFSWFGFCRVLKAKNSDGTRLLKSMPLSKATRLDSIIGDLEAMLIKSMAVNNVNHMKFKAAEEWSQIKKDEWDKFAKRL